jgi:hypothetical protein
VKALERNSGFVVKKDFKEGGVPEESVSVNKAEKGPFPGLP